MWSISNWLIGSNLRLRVSQKKEPNTNANPYIEGLFTLRQKLSIGRRISFIAGHKWPQWKKRDKADAHYFHYFHRKSNNKRWRGWFVGNKQPFNRTHSQIVEWPQRRSNNLYTCLLCQGETSLSAVVFVKAVAFITVFNTSEQCNSGFCIGLARCRIVTPWTLRTSFTNAWFGFYLELVSGRYFVTSTWY